MNPNMQNVMASRLLQTVGDEETDEGEEEIEGGMILDSSSSSSKFDESRLKRQKVNTGGPPPCCLVENCESDLSVCKKYHQRHKVCEVHAKAPLVLVDGIRQRFCQQCSRFHEISEFDHTKRSCRRRLAGHNERRRKSTLESQKQSSSRRLKEDCRQLKERTEISSPENQTFPIL